MLLWGQVVAGTCVRAKCLAWRAFVAICAIALANQNAIDRSQAVGQTCAVLAAADQATRCALGCDERSVDDVVGSAKKAGIFGAGVLAKLLRVLACELGWNAASAVIATGIELGRPGWVSADIAGQITSAGGFAAKRVKAWNTQLRGSASCLLEQARSLLDFGQTLR